MKISKVLQKAKEELRSAKIESDVLDSMILLCHSLNFSREQVVFNPDLELTQNQIEIFFQLIARRKNREPISHIINKREFYGLDFFVDKNVLDPRADSESLIELVLENVDKNKNLEILEIGSGSGCLIITLLKNLINAKGMAVDISKEAIAIAKKNSQTHQVDSRLEFIYSDIFEKISNKKFDIIISNPPYIKTKAIENLQDEVRLFEPRLALDGGIDGLNFYKRIAKESSNFLKKDGIIFLEVGDDQKKEVTEIFDAQNFKLQKVKKDLAGFERALMFILN